MDKDFFNRLIELVKEDKELHDAVIKSKRRNKGGHNDRR